jgi:tripartite-type tricarboxylate transporter receptor subunit TctC
MIKGYAVGSPKRNPALPSIPTTKEAGLPEFQATGWYALFAPRATPEPILDKLTDALDKALMMRAFACVLPIWGATFRRWIGAAGKH